MRSLFRIAGRFAGPVLLVAAEIAAAFALYVAVTPPASAQWGFQFPGFFDQRQRRQAPGWGGSQGWGWPQQQGPPQERREAPVDYSKAPPPHKREAPATMNIVVLGDSMADWLGYGLEEAFGETPEIGVVRKPRANRGLIKIETRNEAYDAVAAVREVLNAEKPDFVVMMTGLADRQSIHEKPAAKPAAAPGQPASPAQNNQQAAKQAAPAEQAAPPVDAEAGTEDKPVIAQETVPAGPGGTYPFRSDKWAEAYTRRIDETIAALKSKGAPVFWVGLPAIRGTKSTSDMVYLNDLYRGRAEKAGIIYVDVWDGFVDEDGTFAASGPDFEGQIRRLRAGDGVHFTKAGARKLAHYVEREIRRVMLARGGPVAMPVPEEKEQPQAPAAANRPGTPPARPAAGPVVPLFGQPAASEALLGGGPRHAAGNDPLADRVLVKGEPMSAPAGRADNFAWPRSDSQPAAAPAGTSAALPANAPPEPAAPQQQPAAASTAAPDAAKQTPPPKQVPKQTIRRPGSPMPLGGRDDDPRPPGAIPSASSNWPYRR